MHRHDSPLTGFILHGVEKQHHPFGPHQSENDEKRKNQIAIENN